MTIHETATVSQRWPEGLNPSRALDFAAGVKSVVILKTLWYPEIVDALVESARGYLMSVGVAPSAISVRAVPGSFELPLSAKMFIESKNPVPDFIVANGMILRGDTPHFDYVCSAVADGVQKVMLDTGVPVGFGVLTVDTVAQAFARKEKGQEAAQAAFLMYCQKQMLMQGDL